jgi:DNA-binding MarR family transcriptional regulator
VRPKVRASETNRAAATIVDAAALLLIGKNEDISQIDLTAALGTDQSTMVAICTRLEGRGFVESSTTR